MIFVDLNDKYINSYSKVSDVIVTLTLHILHFTFSYIYTFKSQLSGDLMKRAKLCFFA